MTIERICVFAGSSFGRREAYREAAASLGRELARRGIGLVYGGASVGLMGVLADAALAGGGTATGVLPKALADLELAHTGLTDLHIVASMHERKAMMADLSDAFIALPGGIGTMEETFEVWTWSQLGFHRKPVGLLNISGFYDRLGAFLDDMVEEGFVKQIHRDMTLTDTGAAGLLDKLAAADIAHVPKWVDRGER